MAQMHYGICEMGLLAKSIPRMISASANLRDALSEQFRIYPRQFHIYPR